MHKLHDRILIPLLCIILLLSGCGSAPAPFDSSVTDTESFGVSIAAEAVSVPPSQTAAPPPSVSPEADTAPSDTPAPAEDGSDALLPHEYGPEQTAAPHEMEQSAVQAPGVSADPANQAVPAEESEDMPLPEAEPAPASADTAALESLVSSLVSGYGGTWSVYFCRTDTGERFCINDSSMVAASLIKLFVYGAVRESIESGLIGDSCRSTLQSMITVSDNTACNSLIDTAGGFDPINRFIQNNGFTASQLNRKMLSGDPVENYTSTRDCGAVLEAVLNGTYVSSETSSMLLSDLQGQTRRGKIPSGIPSGIATANKTGELAGIENDAAIIFSPACTYILCVMTSGVNSGTAVSNISSLSAAVYGFLNY